MAEPEAIVHYLNLFFAVNQTLKGKKVLVTAGPTYEAIDPVRFIGNHSSGKMGYAIAEELYRRGADVTLVSGPVSIRLKTAAIQLIRVNTAEEMYEACWQYRTAYDIAVLAAAVVDYTPVEVADQKIKKSEGEWQLVLKKTKDILKSLGAVKQLNQILVGFALETTNEEGFALKKLEEKNADAIVLNSLNDAEAGFSKDTNKVTIFSKTKEKRKFPAKAKELVASDIADFINELIQ